MATFDSLVRRPSNQSVLFGCRCHHEMYPLFVILDVKNLQNPDGSFAGDSYGETDTRFSYCALSCASLLGRLDELNVENAIEYLISCQVRITLLTF